jgi:hypothetical protein
MVTKYTRETAAYEGIEARRTPWIRQGPPTRRMTPRQRTFVIILGLIIVGALARLAFVLNQGAPYVFQPLLRGSGVITALAPGPAGPESRLATVAIVVDAHTFEASCPVPGPFGAQLAAGDRLAVLYRLSEMGRELTLVECGLVALPD